MILKEVYISSFRSIKQPISIPVDPKITVILGANDNGKSNILEALRLLNRDQKFDPESDLNWDQADKENFPSIGFQFLLSEEERSALLEFIKKKSSTPTPPQKSNPDDDLSEEVTVALEDIPKTFELYIDGLKGARTYTSDRGSSGFLTEYLDTVLPRVEIIKPHDKFPDSLTLATYKDSNHEFMRGILYFAGIASHEIPSLFEQSDVTTKRLAEASKILSTKLRANWSQGENLDFFLHHDSKSNEIQLRINDPAVAGRHVRASQRSSGFTHFFTLRTLLHARKTEYPANSYIFLFDEPGIFLHPLGQHDLLQVLEDLGTAHQVFYTTHSLFMLNKTFPIRHRLVRKTDEGTVIDTKPYVGQWGGAIEALGLGLTGTILFAEKVLLTEGDTDPIYLFAIMQKLAAAGRLNVNLNPLSIMAAPDTKHAEVIIRILSEANPKPTIVHLLDGDDGGRKRAKALDAVFKHFGVEKFETGTNLAIEDCLPKIEEIYLPGVAKYLARLASDGIVQHPDLNDEAKIIGLLEAQWRSDHQRGGAIAPLSKWTDAKVAELFGIKGGISKIGIAREYVALLENYSLNAIDAHFFAQAQPMIDGLVKLLKLDRVAPQATIFSKS